MAGCRGTGRGDRRVGCGPRATVGLKAGGSLATGGEEGRQDKRGKTQGSKWVANARRYLPAALDTAPISPAACGLVTSCWIRIAVGVTSLP